MSKKMTPSEAQKEITKFFGEDSIFFDGNISTKYESISTGSPSLDEAIGIGGVPRGRITQFAGKESSGKTMLALSCIREYLNENPNNTALFIDAEYTYDPTWAEKQGVDISRVMVIKTNEAKKIFEGLLGKTKVNKTTKKVTKGMRGILDHVIEGVDPKFKNLGIIVLDSIAVLNTPLEISADIGKSNMAPIPRFMSTELKKLTPVVAEANVVFIGINQVRVNIGQMFGDPTCVDPFTTKIKIRYEI
jgi:recombination protein RecA